MAQRMSANHLTKLGQQEEGLDASSGGCQLKYGVKEHVRRRRREAATSVQLLRFRNGDR